VTAVGVIVQNTRRKLNDIVLVPSAHQVTNDPPKNLPVNTNRIVVVEVVHGTDQGTGPGTDHGTDRGTGRGTGHVNEESVGGVVQEIVNQQEAGPILAQNLLRNKQAGGMKRSPKLQVVVGIRSTQTISYL